MSHLNYRLTAAQSRYTSSLLSMSHCVSQCCREKAPFVLIVEVLAAAGQEGSPQPATAEATDDEGCSGQARRRASGDLYADSAHSFASRRVSTHAQAGPGESL